MGALTTQQETRLTEARSYLGSRMKSFEAVLPSHIKPERFLRTVLTALTMQPKLLAAPADMLLNECLRAAQDGLMPDGKEAALVPRYGKEFSIAYQPMIAGIRKKARNSGEISTWDARVVRENDHFNFGYGMNPFLDHTYDVRKPRGDMIAVYSVATLKDGTKSFDVMSVEDVNRIRDRSDAWRAFQEKKIKSTPWADHPEEMARKTVARRHSKELPTSTDLDRLLYQGDDDRRVIDYGDVTANAPAPRTLEGKLDALAKEDGETIDGETGEVIDGKVTRGSTREQAEADKIVDDDGTKTKDRDGDIDNDDPVKEARRAGREDAKAGKSKRQMPSRYRNEDALFDAYNEGHDSVKNDD